jgi:predicted nucleic acid-binding protein
MNYLLDTCVLSELVKTDPSPNVLAWICGQQEHQLYISSISWAELHRGVAKLPPSKRRNELTVWLSALSEQFGDRKLPFSAEAGEHWALMMVALESQGKPMPLMDSLICATARHHNMTLVTRNTKDFVNAQVALLDPWQ